MMEMEGMKSVIRCVLCLTGAGPVQSFILIIPHSQVWRGLDKMQAEQPENYSRILEESVQWQNKANSVPEPCKVNHDLIILTRS